MWPNPRIPSRLATERPRLAPPLGKPLVVNVVVAIEYWPFDRPMPRGVLPAPHGKPSEPPDVANYSWVEYGLRCGAPRLLDALARRDIRASAWMNAQCADVYPQLAEAIAAARWDFVGHSWFQRSIKEADDEEEEVRRCLDRIERLTGKRPRGWFGAGGGETDRTPEVLVRCGLDYTHDWLVDDLPCWMHTDEGPLLCLPYTWELNDVTMWAVQGQSSDEIVKRLRATLAVLDRELEHQPRVLSIGLHPHVAGVAHRLHYVEAALDLLLARGDTVFMTSDEIAEWFVGADPDGRAHLEAALAHRGAAPRAS
jgi:peptidoglycan/xylan/chitin deacetylase (PgdA/CDA1 family)